MRFVSVNGTVARLRRFVSRHSSVSAEEVKDPSKLAEIIRQLSVRVAELEAKVPPEGTEFEFTTIGTTISPETVRFYHGFSGPVRWYITHWAAAAGTAPDVVFDATNSDTNNLVLTSQSSGTLVVRIEPSQAGLS